MLTTCSMIAGSQKMTVPVIGVIWFNGEEMVENTGNIDTVMSGNARIK